MKIFGRKKVLKMFDKLEDLQKRQSNIEANRQQVYKFYEHFNEGAEFFPPRVSAFINGCELMILHLDEQITKFQALIEDKKQEIRDEGFVVDGDVCKARQMAELGIKKKKGRDHC